MTTLLAVLSLFLAASAPAGPQPVAKATASKTEVSVGETFTVEVSMKGPPGSTYTFPAGTSQEAFELRTAPAGPDSLPEGTHRYQAEVFALGEARLPPIPVRFRLPDGTTGVATSDSIALTVVSLLPKDKGEQKLADVRGPVAVPIGRAFWIALAALAVLAAAAVAWLVSRRRRAVPVAEAPVPVLEPDVEALRALETLVGSGRLARGEYRPFYIELTAIAKRYLERRLAAPIVEMTSAEMLSHLRGAPLGVDLAPTLRDLAGAADQIKFARGHGLSEEAERHLGATRALIGSLEARLRPAAPEGGRAA